MESLPCGCDKLQESRKITDGNAPLHAAAGRAWQRDWRCPAVGLGRAFPRDTRDLNPRGRRVLAQVEALTGTTKLTTCPCAYTRRVDLVPALRWRERRDKHWLLWTAPAGPLPALLVAQVEAIDQGQNRRHAHELQLMRENAKKPPSA